jgi:hypothetical protein
MNSTLENTLAAVLLLPRAGCGILGVSAETFAFAREEGRGGAIAERGERGYSEIWAQVEFNF